MPKGKTSSGRRFAVVPGTEASEPGETKAREVYLVGYHSGGKPQDYYGCKSCATFMLTHNASAFSTGVIGYGECEIKYEGVCDHIEHWSPPNAA